MEDKQLEKALEIKEMYHTISKFISETYPEATTKDIMATLTTIIVTTMAMLDRESKLLLATAIVSALQLCLKSEEANDE